VVEPYLVPNSLLNIVSGAVALGVSYYAFRYRRVTGSGFLRYLSVGFMLLGVGLLAQASLYLFAAFNLARVTDRIALIYSATALYLVLQSAAYLIIAAGYTVRVQKGMPMDRAEALAPVVAVGPVMPLLFRTLILDTGELVILVLVSFIAFQGAMAYSEQRNRFSLIVLLAFALIALSHLGELAGSILTSGFLYVIGGTANLAGFVLLLVFVIWSGRVGSS
jgi:hypothetical protein